MIKMRIKKTQGPKSKYHNIKVGGYDSKKERNRANKLRLLEKGGVIKNLQEQVPFELIPSQYKIVKGKKKCIERSCKYIADFVYEENGETVVEDTKSPITRTPAYIIKRKLMLHLFNIEIKEV